MMYHDLSPDLRSAYEDLDDTAKQHPLEFVDGVLRFKKNAAVTYMYDHRGQDAEYVLNQMWVEHAHGRISLEDLREWYRLTGTSLCGYLEACVYGR